MQLALIPPTPLLRYTRMTHYQLMLPQYVQDIEYSSMYNNLCSNRSQYVILDNGANEGHNVTITPYITMAVRFGADEIVAPDAIGNQEGTIWLTRKFMKLYKVHRQKARVKVGIVAAGRDYKESAYTAQQLIEEFPTEVKTVFIPRSLVTQVHPTSRIEVAKLIHDQYPDAQIHMLGSSHYWIREIATIREECPYVRGLDTSAPFNYAYAGRRIDDGSLVQRPPNYFNLRMANRLDLVEYNIKRMIQWAGDDERAKTSSSKV